MAQNRLVELSAGLEALAIEKKGLNENVDLSVSSAPISEVIRGIAISHNLNVSISDSIEGNLTNTFSDVSVKDVFIFMCKEYNLTFEIIGEIIDFGKFSIPQQKVDVPKVKKEPKVEYSENDSLISFEFKKDTLKSVVETISRVTGVNVILGPKVEKDLLVNIFLSNSPLISALDKLCYSLGLSLKETTDGFFVIENSKEEFEKAKNQSKGYYQEIGNKKRGRNRNFEILNSSKGKVSVFGGGKELEDVIKEVAKVLNVKYFLHSKLEGDISFYMDNVSFSELLDFLFVGTPYAYLNRNDVFIIGDRNQEALRSTEVYRFKFRTVQDINQLIPNEIKKGVQISEFRDLNALVLCGSAVGVQEVISFLNQIDQVVPMIQIEVLILDVSRSNTTDFGISGGLGGESVPSSTSGSVYPNLDLNLASQSINSLINSFNGYGLINLGKVTPKFYLNINALERNGYLKVKSTPKLSTLNGKEASLSIGETEYYLQVRNDFIGSQNPSLSQQENWQSINANLTITIDPIVSSDDFVTLDIGVIQSSFTERVSPTSPPGSVHKDFQSTIRVRNGEMILLGGLENASVSNSGEGVPLLSRIPIIKWLFSKRIREKSKSKLNILIKPLIF